MKSTRWGLWASSRSGNDTCEGIPGFFWRSCRGACITTLLFVSSRGGVGGKFSSSQEINRWHGTLARRRIWPLRSQMKGLSGYVQLKSYLQPQIPPRHPPDLPSSCSYSVSLDRSCRRSSSRRQKHTRLWSEITSHGWPPQIRRHLRWAEIMRV